MPPVVSLDQIAADLAAHEQQRLQQGEVVRTGQDGHYSVWAIAQASPETVWSVLTDYENFPRFLPSVVSCRVLEQRSDRTLVERKDRRKIGWMPINVKLLTENVEIHPERIHYRLVKGNLDDMEGTWRLTPVETHQPGPSTLVIQDISATASMGPLQGYFYDVFEQGLVDTMADLRAEMEKRDR